MTNNGDLELIASSAKAMAKHFRAFVMAEEIINKVVNAESNLRELKAYIKEHEKHLESIQAEIEKYKLILEEAKNKNADIVSDMEARTAERLKELEAQIQLEAESCNNKLAALRASHEKAKKNVDRDIEARKAQISELATKHFNLIEQYGKEEKEALERVELAKAEIEKARNILG